MATVNFVDLIGKIVSFELHAVGILANTYSNVVVDGIIPASDCDRYGVDAYSLHAQVYRQIPEGTMKDDPESYYYVLIRNQDGQKTVLGIPWIDHDSIQVHNQITATFTVTDIRQADVERIANVIKRYGYNVSYNTY